MRGLPDAAAGERVLVALRAVGGVRAVSQPHPGQIEVTYDPASATVMDLIRAVRGQGFLAGML